MGPYPHKSSVNGGLLAKPQEGVGGENVGYLSFSQCYPESKLKLTDTYLPLACVDGIA